MKIGVLALQGSFKEHVDTLKKLGVLVVPVKSVEDLEGVKGLIMPGGESTTIGKLLKKTGLDEAIKDRLKEGMAVLGTCAGAILLAKNIAGKDQADTLKLMDITIERNSYGPQIESFEMQLEFDLGRGTQGRLVPGIFIRAPRIIEVGNGVEILARNLTEIVAAREKNLLVTCFHPELTDDLAVHKYFLEMCENGK